MTQLARREVNFWFILLQTFKDCTNLPGINQLSALKSAFHSKRAETAHLRQGEFGRTPDPFHPQNLTGTSLSQDTRFHENPTTLRKYRLSQILAKYSIMEMECC